MLESILRIISRKFLYYLKFIGRRKVLFLAPPLVLVVLVLWPACRWFAAHTSRALLPPLPPDTPLQHFRRSRSLQHYLTHTQILIEPSVAPCGSIDEVRVITLVSSAPPRAAQRQAVRDTWAKHQKTFFVMGLHGERVDEQLVDNYIEAKQYSDLIVFDFRDHYQNLTLKTALMLQWTLDNCPQTEFLFKTDDDVLVNPWTLQKVMEQNVDAQLLGYSRNNTLLHRDEYNKWYVPRWLHYEDQVSRYLSGTGYLINGDFLPQIMEAAVNVPLMNLEDIYFTYLVAHKELGLKLTHDKRLSPTKPWLKVSCMYWWLASTHSLDPHEMRAAWAKLEGLMKGRNHSTNICSAFNEFFGSWRDYGLTFE
ncbi:unnamed protein product [Chrysodeixis includens]|uniref:Hexosyltransferase n=1 Tax=Chrysodeixis includens TaxID=689277 RepID=A0A9N8L4A5_CHRIL|nr:unnamed protein product [Chrysodeixis includens]